MAHGRAENANNRRQIGTGDNFLGVTETQRGAI
jgi:hypothetical protein